METMRIGSSVIHLGAIYDINCEECSEGTIVRVEYPHVIKEYLVPGFFQSEVVAAAIQRGINDERNSFGDFDLVAKLLLGTTIYGDIKVNETKSEN